MWVSGKEFQKLTERVAQLEQWKSLHETAVSFTVFDEEMIRRLRAGSLYLYTGVPQQTISVKDVVHKILAKLGMELVYIAGTPAKAEMQKKKA